MTEDMKKLLTISVLVALSVSAAAQGVNSTVSVTNDYRSRAADVNKQTMEMLVPDSLLHFDYKFDYSVFESPYRGAYEFSPYSIKVSPEAAALSQRKLFLRAGAGYTLHPVLDFVWAPVSKGKCAVSVYNTGRGFLGNYTGNASSCFGEGTFSGWDASDRFGVESRWTLAKAEVKAAASYDFIGAGDGPEMLESMTHAVHANAGIASVGSVPVAYRVNIDGEYLSGSDYPATTPIPFNEYSAGLDGSAGMGRGAGRIKLDFAARYYSFSAAETAIALPHFSLTPHYDFVYGILNVSAGVRLDYTDRFSIAPDVRISLGAVNDDITVYAGASGGQYITDFYTLKQGFHRALASCTTPGPTHESLHIYAGLDGHFGSPFRYAFKFGWVNYERTALETCYGYASAMFARIYGNLNLSYVNERIEADVNLGACSMLIDEERVGATDYVRDPSLNGSASFTYNWSKRIYATLFAEGRTAREGVAGTLPGWVDLGVRAELKPSAKWGLWAEAGNLLGMTMWRNFPCAESGRRFTAGITLTL